MRTPSTAANCEDNHSLSTPTNSNLQDSQIEANDLNDISTESEMPPIIKQRAGLRKFPRITAQKSKPWHKDNLISRCFCVLLAATPQFQDETTNLGIDSQLPTIFDHDGSSQMSLSDPILVTYGTVKISDNFRSVKYGKHNLLAFQKAQVGTNLSGLSTTQNHNSQFHTHLIYRNSNFYGNLPKWRKFVTHFDFSPKFSGWKRIPSGLWMSY